MRDYLEVSPLPNAQAVLELIRRWNKDYNEKHPYAEPNMQSSCDFIAAQFANAQVSGATKASHTNHSLLKLRTF